MGYGIDIGASALKVVALRRTLNGFRVVGAGRRRIPKVARPEDVKPVHQKLLYDAMDASGGFYRPHAEPDSRSNMNVTFRLPSEELEKRFVSEATPVGLDGLKGHRSVGGIRASLYNAFPRKGVETLVSFMKEFQKRNG
jgi:phosphoserine aminotransferase